MLQQVRSPCFLLTSVMSVHPDMSVYRYMVSSSSDSSVYCCLRAFMVETALCLNCALRESLNLYTNM